MNIAAYQAKRYGPQPCWELVADVLAHERAEIAVEYIPAQRSIRQMAEAFRLALHASHHGFRRVTAPEEFSIVLMGRNAHLGIHHCGVWVGGKVLHAEPCTTLYEELTAVATRYPVMEFWSHED